MVSNVSRVWKPDETLALGFEILLEQRHFRDTARTNIQPSVAWVKLTANWIGGKGRGGGGWKGMGLAK